MAEPEPELKSEPDANAIRGSESAHVSKISYIRSWLQARYPVWQGGEELGRVRLSVLMGRHPGRSTIIVFRGRERWPRIVVKLATDEEGATRLTREAGVLDHINRELQEFLDHPLPRHLGLLNESHLAALATTALRGRRATLPDLTVSEPKRNDRRRLQYHIDAVREWSRSLSQARTSVQQPRHTGYAAHRIQRFIDLSNPAKKTRGRLERLSAAMEASDARWLPCWQHGDVASGNVLWHRGRMRLVDWEAASPTHDPWRDDAYLILSLARAAQRTMGSSSVSPAFLGPLGSGSWPGRILESNYREFWPHPIPVGWAVVATTIENALKREKYGTTNAVWRNLAIDLVSDDRLRTKCNWLVPGL